MVAPGAAVVGQGVEEIFLFNFLSSWIWPGLAERRGKHKQTQTERGRERRQRRLAVAVSTIGTKGGQRGGKGGEAQCDVVVVARSLPLIVAVPFLGFRGWWLVAAGCL